jgi:hypothetical protein
VGLRLGGARRGLGGARDGALLDARCWRLAPRATGLAARRWLGRGVRVAGVGEHLHGGAAGLVDAVAGRHEAEALAVVLARRVPVADEEHLLAGRQHAQDEARQCSHVISYRAPLGLASRALVFVSIALPSYPKNEPRSSARVVQKWPGL